MAWLVGMCIGGLPTPPMWGFGGEPSDPCPNCGSDECDVSWVDELPYTPEEISELLDEGEISPDSNIFPGDRKVPFNSTLVIMADDPRATLEKINRLIRKRITQHLRSDINEKTLEIFVFARTQYSMNRKFNFRRWDGKRLVEQWRFYAPDFARYILFTDEVSARPSLYRNKVKGWCKEYKTA